MLLVADANTARRCFVLFFLRFLAVRVSEGLAVAMAKRQQQFVFVDYVHYDRE